MVNNANNALFLLLFLHNTSFGDANSALVSCATSMSVCGHRRLGYATSSAGSGYVRLNRNGVVLNCGSMIKPGESLGMSTFSIPSGSDILIEIRGATSISSRTARCSKTRSLGSDGLVVVPTSGTITIQIAYGNQDKGTVYLSPICSYTVEAVTCQSCPSGEFLSGCAASSPGSCVACPAGTFAPSIGFRTSCIACAATCSDGFYQTSDCTSTSDRVCTACSPACSVGTFEYVNCASGADRTCLACSPACSAGTYQVSDCTVATDRVCAPCSPPCGPGEYELAACGAGSDRVCVSCGKLVCGAGSYLAGCGRGVVGACALCSSGSCGEGRFQSVVCGGDSDRVCSPCAAGCSVFGYYVNQACTNTSNTACLPCTRCPASSFTVVACGAASNTICSTCTACAPGQYEAAPCSTDSDRVCHNCTTCPPGTFVFGCGAGVPGKCRTCSPLCAVGEYESAPCGGLVDRTCATASPCDAGWWSSTGTAPGCTPCPAGRFAATASATTCDECQANSESVPGAVGCRCRRGFVPTEGGAMGCVAGRWVGANVTRVDVWRSGRATWLEVSLGAVLPRGWVRITVRENTGGALDIAPRELTWNPAAVRRAGVWAMQPATPLLRDGREEEEKEEEEEEGEEEEGEEEEVDEEEEVPTSSGDVTLAPTTSAPQIAITHTTAGTTSALKTKATTAALLTTSKPTAITSSASEVATAVNVSFESSVHEAPAIQLRVRIADWTRLAAAAARLGGALALTLDVASSDSDYAALSPLLPLPMDLRDDTCAGRPPPLGAELAAGQSAACANPDVVLPKGTRCRYLCASGLAPSGGTGTSNLLSAGAEVGETDAECLGGRVWSAAPPADCVAVVCDPLDMPSGWINCSGSAAVGGGWMPGAVCAAGCGGSAQLLGSALRECGADGVWTGAAASCSCAAATASGRVTLGIKCEVALEAAAVFFTSLSPAGEVVLGVPDSPGATANATAVAGLRVVGGTGALVGGCPTNPCKLSLAIFDLAPDSAATTALLLGPASATMVSGGDSVAIMIARGPLLNLGPDGLRFFGGTAQLTARFNRTAVIGVGNLSLRTFDERLRRWEEIPDQKVLLNQGIVRANLTHFSLYAVIESVSAPVRSHSAITAYSASIRHVTSSTAIAAISDQTSSPKLAAAAPPPSLATTRVLFSGEWAGAGMVTAQAAVAAALLGMMLAVSLLGTSAISALTCRRRRRPAADDVIGASDFAKRPSIVVMRVMPPLVPTAPPLEDMGTGAGAVGWPVVADAPAFLLSGDRRPVVAWGGVPTAPSPPPSLIGSQASRQGGSGEVVFTQGPVLAWR